jgi:hypothetical protein
LDPLLCFHELRAEIPQFPYSQLEQLQSQVIICAGQPPQGFEAQNKRAIRLILGAPDPELSRVFFGEKPVRIPLCLSLETFRIPELFGGQGDIT